MISHHAIDSPTKDIDLSSLTPLLLAWFLVACGSKSAKDDHVPEVEPEPVLTVCDPSPTGSAEHERFVIIDALHDSVESLAQIPCPQHVKLLNLVDLEHFSLTSLADFTNLQVLLLDRRPDFLSQCRDLQSPSPGVANYCRDLRASSRELVPVSVAKKPERFRAMLDDSFEFVAAKGYTDPSGLVGEGNHGIAYLVRTVDLHDLFVAKFLRPQVADVAFSQGTFANEVKNLNTVYQHLPQYCVEARRAGEAVIKSYVPGKTLRDWIVGGPLFSGSEASQEARGKLIDLFADTADQALRIKDVNNGNLVYHEWLRRWIVVDSEGLEFHTSPRDAFDSYVSTMDFDLRYLVGHADPDIHRWLQGQVSLLKQEILSVRDHLEVDVAGHGVEVSDELSTSTEV